MFSEGGKIMDRVREGFLTREGGKIVERKRKEEKR